jgi:hypothetical protein
LEKRYINIGKEGIVKVFKLPREGLMAGARKGFNGVVANGVYKNTI